MVEFEDGGFGMLDEACASLETGWKELYGTYLKSYVESKGKKKDTKKK